MQPPGSLPILVVVGNEKVRQQVAAEKVVRELVVNTSFLVDSAGGSVNFNETTARRRLSAAYGVPINQLSIRPGFSAEGFFNSLQLDARSTTDDDEAAGSSGSGGSSSPATGILALLAALNDAAPRTVVTIDAGGTVEAYGEEQRARLVDDLRRLAGVATTDESSLKIVPGSVTIEAIIALRDASESKQAAKALVASLGNAAAASAALGVSVMGTPQVVDASTGVGNVTAELGAMIGVNVTNVIRPSFRNTSKTVLRLVDIYGQSSCLPGFYCAYGASNACPRGSTLKLTVKRDLQTPSNASRVPLAST